MKQRLGGNLAVKKDCAIPEEAPTSATRLKKSCRSRSTSVSKLLADFRDIASQCGFLSSASAGVLLLWWVEVVAVLPSSAGRATATDCASPIFLRRTAILLVCRRNECKIAVALARQKAAASSSNYNEYCTTLYRPTDRPTHLQRRSLV